MASKPPLDPGDHTFNPPHAPDLTLHYTVIPTTNSSLPSPPRYLIIHPPPWGVGYAIYLTPLFTSPLLQHFTLVCISSRGTPPSTRPSSPLFMSPSHIIADLESFRQHLNLSKINLFGHSAGASISLGYALRYPQHINRVIAACPAILTGGSGTQIKRPNATFANTFRNTAESMFASVDSEPNTNLFTLPDDEFFANFLTQAFAKHPPLTNADFNKFMVEVAPVYLSPVTQSACTEPLREGIRALAAPSSTTTMSPTAEQAQQEGEKVPLPDIWCYATFYGCVAREGWDQIADLRDFALNQDHDPDMKGKVLLVPGRDDLACEAKTAERAFEAATGGKKGSGNGSVQLAVIEECGHFPWLEQKERWWEVVLPFLNEES